MFSKTTLAAAAIVALTNEVSGQVVSQVYYGSNPSSTYNKYYAQQQPAYGGYGHSHGAYYPQP